MREEGVQQENRFLPNELSPVVTMNLSLPRSTGLALALGATLLLAPSNRAAEKPSKLSPVDEKFLQDEATAGKALATIAGEAASRGGSEVVRAFARSLVHDHEKANAELSKLAAAKEVELAPGDFNPHRDRLNSIRALKGDAFDREFVSLMIEKHAESVENFEKASVGSPDVDLKKWASRMLPGLKAHLNRAKELSSEKSASTENKNLIVL